jgi:hypothetical protein
MEHFTCACFAPSHNIFPLPGMSTRQVLSMLLGFSAATTVSVCRVKEAWRQYVSTVKIRPICTWRPYMEGRERLIVSSGIIGKCLRKDQSSGNRRFQRFFRFEAGPSWNEHGRVGSCGSTEWKLMMICRKKYVVCINKCHGSV